MACTPADIRELDVFGADFLDPPYTDAVLQTFIDAATLLVAECGDKGDAALCYLSAHLAMRHSQGGAGNIQGPIASASAGGLAASFQTVMLGGLDPFLSTTLYGQMYLMLRDSMSCGVVPLVLRD